MWFVFGLLCGVAVGAALCWLQDGELPDAEQGSSERADTHKEWVKTRNFLYYDGTEMPVVKEDEYEQ